MASFVDLEDEDLIDADENDLYNTIDEHGNEGRFSYGCSFLCITHFSFH